MILNRPASFHPEIDWDLVARKMLEENPELTDSDEIRIYAVTRGGGVIGRRDRDLRLVLCHSVNA